MKRISLFYPTIYKKEWLEALEKVFSTRWIGQGPLVDQFDREFGEKFGYKYCLSVNSGTASLDLAYHLIGIKEGDEVLVPVLTCTATNIPLIRRKAVLKFIDIDSRMLPSFSDIEKKVSKKTKAIVVVNLGGLHVDKRIFKLAKEMNIPVVIDAAQSVGISEKNGDYICYSFQAIKHFTTGDGGMLVVRTKKEYERAKRLRWFGIDREKKKKANWKHIVNHQMAMEIEEAGYKYQMNDIAAALGLVGLKHSDESLSKRKQICEQYQKELYDYSLVFGGSYWLIAILVENRDDLFHFLQRNGVDCDVVQLRNDIFKIFGGERQLLPGMNYAEDKYLYLPLHLGLTKEDVSLVSALIRKWNNKK